MLGILRAVLGLLLWVLITPFCIGLLVNFILPRARRTIGITFILGYLVYMGIFEVVAITCMLRATYSAFSYCRRFFAVIVIILSVMGIVRSIIKLSKGEESY